MVIALLPRRREGALGYKVGATQKPQVLRPSARNGGACWGLVSRDFVKRPPEAGS